MEIITQLHSTALLFVESRLEARTSVSFSLGCRKLDRTLLWIYDKITLSNLQSFYIFKKIQSSSMRTRRGR